MFIYVTPVGIYKSRLVSKHKMNGSKIKHRWNIEQYVLIGVSADQYDALINTSNLLLSTYSYIKMCSHAHRHHENMLDLVSMYKRYIWSFTRLLRPDPGLRKTREPKLFFF